LESLLPVHAAEGLRLEQEKELMIHNSVTMFFSDIVDFTSSCKEISPKQVIDMLNQLYGIMVYLAGKFFLFKDETIGDANVCAGGLATEDSNHHECCKLCRCYSAFLPKGTLSVRQTTHPISNWHSQW
jgi:heat-stable enterotoxin receptor